MADKQLVIVEQYTIHHSPNPKPNGSGNRKSLNPVALVFNPNSKGIGASQGNEVNASIVNKEKRGGELTYVTTNLSFQEFLRKQ